MVVTTATRWLGLKRRKYNSPVAGTHPTMPKMLSCGDASLTVEFGSTVDAAMSAQVLDVFERLSASLPKGVHEAVPTLRSLTLHFDPTVTSAAEVAAALGPVLTAPIGQARPGRTWALPVCYDPEFGLDLAEVAARLGCTVDDVIARHAGRPYRVLMLGFLPGFPYMGGLTSELQLPRRDTPRTAVPAGSVAIATNMSVVYTSQSPGGWHILGRTPALLFDPGATHPVLLAPADEVRFEPVSRDTYTSLERAVQDGAWRPDPVGRGGNR
jgi:KipI family sensor histidine kinase inhibitor